MMRFGSKSSSTGDIVSMPMGKDVEDSNGDVGDGGEVGLQMECRLPKA
jgi:hypothetical protein